MSIVKNTTKTSNYLVLQILIGVIVGVILGFVLNSYDIKFLSIITNLLGELFVGALKAFAPILVFALICESIATKEFTSTSQKGLKKIIALYIIGTFLASFCAIIASYLFPITLILESSQKDLGLSPVNLSSVIINLAMKAVDNPVNALANGNFIGILFWSAILGIVLRKSSDETKTILIDASNCVTAVIKYIILYAPLGICGLVASNVEKTGLNALSGYLQLILVLVCCMLFVAFVVNAIIVFIVTRQNPYPLIFTCLKESAITAFFTRSSAANIPVNIALAKKLNISENLYAISIPLGATINMSGAAITISILSLSAAHTLGINVDFATAIFLCFISSIAACGASGVAGGSLMLVPLACALFGISNDIALKVVAIGFIIGVIQDSFETALNSSTDVLFTAAVASRLK